MQIKLRHTLGVLAVVSTTVYFLGCLPSAPKLVISAEPTSEWRTFAGGPERTFFNAGETTITNTNVGDLATAWTFETGAIVTASPQVANLVIPGEGTRSIVFIQSWDEKLYALRVRNGSLLWSFALKHQNASFPNTASVHIENMSGTETIFVGHGERMYSINAVTGAKNWHFDAGTGCGDTDNPAFATSNCDYGAEQNQIESSAYVADGKVFFGMDVDDDVGGKGGFYAVDATDGRLEWFFDLESGMTCTPNPGDNIRRYDGYHSEIELGLDSGFLSTRTGCNHPRNANGCGNVWSSAAVDLGRQELYFASSNCDTDSNPGTLEPPSQAPYTPINMPPYDEALVALDFDGIVQWKWRPRDIDNADLAFGAVPNLFQITVNVGGSPTLVDVVGIGNKDGTYYVIDRDGTNQTSTVTHTDGNANTDLPYWKTKVVTGGAFGGIIATAAVDEAAGKVYFTTAPNELSSPDVPNMHALDINTGTILWQRSTTLGSYGPTAAIPGLVFSGHVFPGWLYAFDTTSSPGNLVYKTPNIFGIAGAIASGPAFVDGILIVGGGVGSRHGDLSDLADINSRKEENITALCVPGAGICQYQE